MAFEMSIQEVARATGTTSRALRHYDSIGLLKPSRVGGNGYRRYDQHALVRLQRILLLRDLGLGLPVIASILDREVDDARALQDHLRWLESERNRIEAQIASIRSTVTRLKKGEPMSEEMFHGFDHTQYKDEVERRWGAQAYADGDTWWRSLSETDKREFQQEQLDIASAFGAAAREGLAADSDDVQRIVERHVRWLAGAPGTPAGSTGAPSYDYVVGLGEMYVADPRFGQNYDRHGEGTAALVRDAMRVFADAHLTS